MIDIIKMSEQDFIESSDAFEGRCLECGAEEFGIEPDAEGYKCEECGAMAVCGLEHILIIGKIELHD